MWLVGRGEGTERARQWVSLIEVQKNSKEALRLDDSSTVGVEVRGEGWNVTEEGFPCVSEAPEELMEEGSASGSEEMAEVPSSWPTQPTMSWRPPPHRLPGKPFPSPFPSALPFPGRLACHAWTTLGTPRGAPASPLVLFPATAHSGPLRGTHGGQNPSVVTRLSPGCCLPGPPLWPRPPSARHSGTSLGSPKMPPSSAFPGQSSSAGSQASRTPRPGRGLPWVPHRPPLSVPDHQLRHGGGWWGLQLCSPSSALRPEHCLTSP